MATAISQVSREYYQRSALSIYILDDDLEFANTLQVALRQVGHSTVVGSDPDFLLDGVRRRRCDVAISDIRMPAMGGLELLSALQTLDSQVPVILMTGFYSIDAAI